MSRRSDRGMTLPGEDGALAPCAAAGALATFTAIRILKHSESRQLWLCGNDSSPMTYDRQIAATEKAGLRALREGLLAGLSGDVLEIGSGTGANLSVYQPYPLSATITEPHPPMLGAGESAGSASLPSPPGRLLCACRGSSVRGQHLRRRGSTSSCAASTTSRGHCGNCAVCCDQEASCSSSSTCAPMIRAQPGCRTG